MAKILIVEDESRLCEHICDCLEAEGYTVESALNGIDAESLLKLSTYDLVVLDWNLPGVTGVELCRRYRADGGMARILMLTGKSSIEDKASGLDSGADDYLTKPFDMREVSARVRALLRRPDEVKAEVLRCRGLELNRRSHQVMKNGAMIELFPKEFAMLEFFMCNQGETFSIEALQKRIWPSDSESSPETLRVHMARLRGKIETEGESALIRTVHRVGYIMDVEEPS